MLDSPGEIVRCLITYTDWWQPATGSVLKVAKARPDKNYGDGLREGLLETLEERTELAARVSRLPLLDRRLLVMWYVLQSQPDDIADEFGVSRRQSFRRRRRAIQKIVEMGRIQEAS